MKFTVILFIKGEERPHVHKCNDVDVSPNAVLMTLDEEDKDILVYPVNENLIHYRITETSDAESN